MREMLEHIEVIDPTLKPLIIRSEVRFKRMLNNLKDKSTTALLQKDDLTKSQFKRLEVQLFPNNVPQERLLSPFSFFLKFGIDYVLNAFLELPFEGDHTIT